MRVHPEKRLRRSRETSPQTTARAFVHFQALLLVCNDKAVISVSSEIHESNASAEEEEDVVQRQRLRDNV